MKDPQDQVRQGIGEAAVTKVHEPTVSRRPSLNGKMRKSFYIPVGLLFFSLVLVGASALIYTRDQHTIVEGVTISEINVGNLPKDQAKTIIDKEIHHLMSQTIKLDVGQQSTEVKLEDLGLTVADDLALQNAYDINRKGSILNKVKAKIAATRGVNIEPLISQIKGINIYKPVSELNVGLKEQPPISVIIKGNE